MSLKPMNVCLDTQTDYLLSRQFGQITEILDDLVKSLIP